ncbi:MAG: TolC family protein [Dokdonella sp.]|uniref:TolC family protein n=1 Tax=Dokdonella sp. TaxID=2291710 RepID=UPI0025BAEC2F|nr:TolC family protein [Dokdonella sp.]MBK8122218.1 TolC family protein [Dokdonella sp.]
MKVLMVAVLLALSPGLRAEVLDVTTPPGLPPTELVQAWLRQDPSVQEADAGLQAARHAAGMLSASPYEFTAKLSSQRRRYEGGGRTSNEWAMDVDRTVRLPGKRAIDRRLGNAEIDLAQTRVDGAMHETARDFVGLWMDWQGAVRARELMREQVKFGEESVRVVGVRRRAGDAATLELNVIEADTAEISRQLSLAISDEEKALAKLRIRFPGADGAALTLADPQAVTQAESVWKERILGTSDPLRIAQVEFEKAELAASRARADRIPDPTIGVYSASEAFSNERVIGVSLTIPIPGRHRNQRLQQALSQVDMALAARDRQLRLLEIEVAQAYSDAKGSFERWQLAEQSGTKTSENARLTQRAYSLGEVDLQTLLLSRRQAVNAADSALDARVLALRSYYTLLVDAHLIWGLEHE